MESFKQAVNASLAKIRKQRIYNIDKYADYIKFWCFMYWKYLKYSGLVICIILTAILSHWNCHLAQYHWLNHHNLSTSQQLGSKANHFYHVFYVIAISYFSHLLASADPSSLAIVFFGSACLLCCILCLLWLSNRKLVRITTFGLFGLSSRLNKLWWGMCYLA